MVAFATQVKRRRGTTAQNDAFTGAEGEIVVDTEKHTLRVHDGETQGGFEMATEDSLGNKADVVYVNERLATKANADLSNIDAQAKETVAGWGIPDYSAGVSVPNSEIFNGYTAPSAGFLATSAGWLNLTVNGNNLPTGKYLFANNAVSLQQIFILLNAGDVLVGTGGYQIDSNIFFPLKGVN